MRALLSKLAKELKIQEPHVKQAVSLLFEQDCTIPFIARYRKEVTGSMDEVQLRELRDRYTYFTELEAAKERYLKVVELHCKDKPELLAQFPEISKKFMDCETKQQLEDLYLPYKPKRRTRAQIAKEKGLEALLDEILQNRAVLTNLEEVAGKYVTSGKEDIPKEQRVENVKEALAGAADILAERINETAEIRAKIREKSFATAILSAKKNENWQKETKDAPSAGEDESRGKSKKGDEKKYENYFDYHESIHTALSHRVMAVRRGEAEKILRVAIEVDADQLLSDLDREVIRKESTSEAVKQWLIGIIQDAYKRLLSPSIETEVRVYLKNKAETDAIKVFSKNLENLLMLPPLPNQNVLGIDPGIRTGSKLAVVNETGKLLEHCIIYPNLSNLDDNKSIDASEKIAKLVSKHAVGYIAIGNGTGGREVDQLVAKAVKTHNLNCKRVVVNEAGASVYSTDDIAREEFPDLDPTIRSAVSIARRLQDPLAELVKIDPRSIGVGQYQHDCNAQRLTQSLKETVESCVNNVGINVNTASYKLLSYVSGIGATLAKNIVSYRDQSGAFASRSDLRKVTGFGPKAFEQAAGFLRVPKSQHPLDNSSVHPERYEIVEKIANDLNIQLADLIGKKETVETIAWEKYVGSEVGMPTLLDISKELIKPGRDPRQDGSRLIFSDSISKMEDLKVGMKLKGTVSNVTNFGAFVDIGVHQDGLVHVSELSEQFIKDPNTVVGVGKVLDVYVIGVDLERKRISLSCKAQTKPQENRPQRSLQEQRQGSGQRYDAKNAGGQQHSQQRPQQGRAFDRDARRGHGREQHSAGQTKAKQFSVGDLLSKFNQRS